MSELQTEERVRADGPRPSGFYGITVPSSDLEQSKRFLVGVLCGKLLEENSKRVRVGFTDFIITGKHIAPKLGLSGLIRGEPL